MGLMPREGVTRIALTGASGNGKTTLARSLSLPLLDLEGASQAQAAQLVARNEWVADATHEHALGDLVLAHAQLLLWLDLPLPLILWRAWRRDRRIRLATIRAHFANRRSVRARAARHPHLRLVRLRSPRQVLAFLEC
jgi:adenylate kinase family enzyme